MKGNNMSDLLSDDEKMLATGYVLGDLTPDELAALEQLIADKPSVVQEIHALQASYELLPQALPVEPPPERVRANILGKIAGDRAVAIGDRAVAADDFPIAERRSARRFVLPILLGLSLLGTALLALDNSRLRYRLAEEVPTERVASILQQPNSRLISLTGNDNEAAGTLLFTPGNWKEVIVSLGDLPALPPDQIYRMWLELENGEVIYCGEFDTDTDGSVFVRFTPLEAPPKGVKTTKLFVTVDAEEASPSPAGDRVMEGVI